MKLMLIRSHNDGIECGVVITLLRMIMLHIGFADLALAEYFEILVVCNNIFGVLFFIF